MIWKTLEKATVFEKLPYLRVTKEKVDVGNGLIIEDFYKVELRSFAIVVPVMLDGRICVLRQYKHGPQRVSLTFPAGFLEENEEPEAGVKRELLEETGTVSEELHFLGTYVDNGNQRGCQGHYYLAKGCQQITAPNSGDLEEMEMMFMSPAQLNAAIQTDEFAIIHNVAAWGLSRIWEKDCS